MGGDSMSWLDRAIRWAAPNAGLRRVQARYLTAAYDRALGAYEGASKGNRLGNWKARPSSANAETRPTLSVLRSRSRDLVRNNPHAKRAVSVITSNTIGTGILLKAEAARKVDGDRISAGISAWMETSDCDADGQLDIYGLQALVMRTVVESGECLIRRRLRYSSDGLAVPLQLQILEPDFLDAGRDGVNPENGNRIVQGVEFDKLGRRAAYWLFSDHPGDSFVFGGAGLGGASFTSARIPASEIIHIYRKDRPGQVRGVPWCAPVIVALKDFADYKDARRVREKIAACFAGFVEGEDTTGVAGTGVGTDGAGNTIPPVEEITPGLIEHLPIGKKVTFATPPVVTDDGFSRGELTAIAAGFDVPYEALTGDLSNVNFSSGRMGWLEFQRNIETWRWTMFIPTFCKGVTAWMLQAQLVQANSVRATYTPPKREMINPVDETEADIAEVRAGFSSWQSKVRARGEDPDQVRRERVADAEADDSVGLVSESDARYPRTGGQKPAPVDPPKTQPKKGA